MQQTIPRMRTPRLEIYIQLLLIGLSKEQVFVVPKAVTRTHLRILKECGLSDNRYLRKFQKMASFFVRLQTKGLTDYKQKVRPNSEICIFLSQYFFILCIVKWSGMVDCAFLIIFDQLGILDLTSQLLQIQKIEYNKKLMIGESTVNRKQEEENSLSAFGAAMLIIQIVMIALIWIFVRVNLASDTSLESQRYPAFQDVNVMMLIGFGFLMTFIRSYAWSALAWTFLINAFVSQYYILLSPFWEKVLLHGFQDFLINIDIVFLIKCSYSVASVLIAFGGLIGRVGPKDILLIGTIHMIGYTLNEQLVYYKIGMVDAGGSSVIHTYGAYFGLTTCLILSTKIIPSTNVKISYVSNIFAFIGTLFLWLYWPSFNFGITAMNTFQQNLIVVNTVLSLIGSVLGTYIVSALSFGRGLQMQSILNATLAGGVVIGAPCSVIYRPGVAIMIGFTTGIISTICIHRLTPRLLKCIGLYDTCGIHNLHGIPGLLGGFWSAIIVAFYDSGYDVNVASKYFTGLMLNIQTSFRAQAGLQVAGTLTSLGMGVVFGIIAGFIGRVFYNEKSQYFYLDSEYFADAHFDEIYRSDKGDNKYLNQKKSQQQYEVTMAELFQQTEPNEEAKVEPNGKM